MDAPGTGAEVADRVRIVLRPVGSGLPLGFFAFGIGMALLGALDLGVVPAGQAPHLGWMLITFVAPAELLAAVIAFASRDGAAGTGLGLFAVSWSGIGVQTVLDRPGGTSAVLGVYLLAFSTAVVLLAVAARRGQPLMAAVLTVSAARGYLDGAHEFGAAGWTQTTAGVLAWLITGMALYGGLAFVLEDGAHRTVLPLGRRGDSAAALDGVGLGGQLAGLDAEAGVRRRL